MPKVIVKQNSKCTPQEAFEKVVELLSDDKDLKKLDPSYKCDFDNEKLTGTATGKMFKANMSVSGSENADVEIVVDLPMALALAKGMVQKTLQRKLDESLG